MRKILVEGIHNTGAIKPLINFRRKLRPTALQLGMASAPFDWITGYDIEGKTGVMRRKNQTVSLSCGGQGGSYFYQAILALLNGQLEEQSAKSVYSPGFAIGGGMTIVSLENRMITGIQDESVVPSNLPDGSVTEAFMELTDWIKANPVIKKLNLQPINVNIDIDSIATAIKNYGGAIMMIQGQNNGTWLSPRPQPPTSNSNLWAHYMYLSSATTNKGVQEIGALNSWGNTIGDNGKQYFGENYINSGYIYDVFTFAQVPHSFVFNNDLYLGMQSQDVVELQKRLNVTPQSGYFGALTLQAVKNYQKLNGVPVTGYIGPITRGFLNK